MKNPGHANYADIVQIPYRRLGLYSAQSKIFRIFVIRMTSANILYSSFFSADAKVLRNPVR